MASLVLRRMKPLFASKAALIPFQSNRFQLRKVVLDTKTSCQGDLKMEGVPNLMSASDARKT